MDIIMTDNLGDDLETNMRYLSKLTFVDKPSKIDFEQIIKFVDMLDPSDIVGMLISLGYTNQKLLFLLSNEQRERINDMIGYDICLDRKELNKYAVQDNTQDDIPDNIYGV